MIYFLSGPEMRMAKNCNICWNVTARSLVIVYGRFGGTFCLRGKGRRLREAKQSSLFAASALIREVLTAMDHKAEVFCDVTPC
jgi:hypothetical protein